ncbi:DivIVA domain-containing protein [Lactobacillus sp.]|uniref:DivIVA domain-containing protein n=1 Tax=Lactobacillus sp. TaxID=1591 RepID=UPI003EF86434
MADLNDIKLSAQDILKKQFRSKVKGYDPDEVDSYLDQIIADYETFQDIIEDLYGRIGELQGEVIQAKKETKEQPAEKTVEIPAPAAPAVPASATTEPKEEDVKTYVPSSQRQRADFSLDSSTSSGEISTNMAIIQRLSTLERKVYNLEQRVYGIQDLQK